MWQIFVTDQQFNESEIFRLFPSKVIPSHKVGGPLPPEEAVYWVNRLAQLGMVAWEEPVEPTQFTARRVS